MADYFLPLSRRKNKRDSDTLYRLLKQWRGKATADTEVISKLPPTKHISESMEEAMKSLLPPHLAVLQKIKHDWDKIAGKQLAQYMTPANMRDGTLFIEVSHPAWLMEFKAKEQKMLLAKIQEHISSKKCNNIKLIPIGKNVQRKH
jgi:hypothetical protein